MNSANKRRQKDPKKVAALVNEIERLLAEKEQSLKGKHGC